MEEAAGILLRCGDSVLLVKRSDDGTWATPGGHIESGETPLKAAIREVHEECGVKVSGTFKLLAEVRSLQIHYWLYYGFVKKQFKPQLNHEHTDWMWAPLDDLPSGIHPNLKPVMRILK